VLALMAAEPAPQQRAALLRIGEAAERQGQRETHGSGLVAMDARRHVMKPGARQALWGKIAVEFGHTHKPRGGLPPLPLELHMTLLEPCNMRAQGRDQRRNALALVERGDGGASFPAPRTSMCRFPTHD
jgi:hypothetical protein